MGISCGEDLKRAFLLKQVTASHSFDSRAGYRLLSLALMQAVAWQYIEWREEGDVLCGKAVAAMWVFPQVLRILKLQIRHGQEN